MQVKSETTVGMLVLGGIIVFFYMGFKIGAFRFDRNRYNDYAMYFDDVSGITHKADVKIAGVKVGWVENLNLLTDGKAEAQVTVMVLKDYALYKNAHAVVRQEGLLGPKYVEIVPGDPLLDKLQSGEALGKGIAPVSMDELMHKFTKIASNIESITDSVSHVMGGVRGERQLGTIFDNINDTARNLAAFSEVLERSFSKNENNIDAILHIGEEIKRVAERLDQKVLPAFQESVEKIASVFERDFNSVAGNLSKTANALEEASIQARDGFASLTSVSEKIDEGKGLIGKLINEDETYRDLKVAVSGLKNYFSQINMLEVVFDAHGETMHRPGDNYRYEDSKFFFDMRIHPNEDHFYIIQIAASERGYISRQERRFDYTPPHREPIGADLEPIDTAHLNLADGDRVFWVFNRQETLINRYGYRLGLQFGKVFNNIAVRLGLIEGFGGLGVDFEVPLGTDKFRWVTSFEIYDLTGFNKIHDRRPHVKWLNKMYMMRNIYFAFGADDFVSKHNANAFLGAGIRFGDDDIKYLLPSFGSVGGGFMKQ